MSGFIPCLSLVLASPFEIGRHRVQDKLGVCSVVVCLLFALESKHRQRIGEAIPKESRGWYGAISKDSRIYNELEGT